MTNINKFIIIKVAVVIIATDNIFWLVLNNIFNDYQIIISYNAYQNGSYDKTFFEDFLAGSGDSVCLRNI